MPKSFVNSFREVSCHHYRIYCCPSLFDDEFSKAAHEWIIEFEKVPDNLDFFKETLDTALKSLNSDYEAKRYKI